MQMTLIATTDEKLKLVYDCLVDGLPFFPSYGLELDYDVADAEKARQTWKERNPNETLCREDVWAEIIRNGGDLIFTDRENDGEEAGRLNLATIDKNWDKLGEEAPRSLREYLSENYDAGNTDALIQVLIFGQVDYG